MVNPIAEVSDVPLTKDVVRQGEPFTATFYEALKRKGTRRIITRVTDTEQTMFTVGPNLEFYVEAITLTATRGAVAGRTLVTTTTTSAIGVLLGLMLNGIADSGSTTINFPYPIKLEVGESITLSISGTIDLICASVIGFDISKSLI